MLKMNTFANASKQDGLADKTERISDKTDVILAKRRKKGE